MLDTLWHHKTLTWVHFDGHVLEVYKQLPIYHIEELILFVMLMPMELSMYHSNTDYTIIYHAQGVILPIFCTRLNDLWNIDEGQ